MISKFLQLPTLETLLNDHLKKTEDELKRCVYLDYFLGSFQIKKGPMKVSIEAQYQLARNYIEQKNDSLAIYSKYQRFICKIQPFQLEIYEDQDGFFIRILSQEKNEIIGSTKEKEFYLSSHFKGRDQSYPNILRDLIKKKSNLRKRPSEKIIQLLENYYRITKQQIKSTEKFTLNCKTSWSGYPGYHTSVSQKRAILKIGQNLLLILSGGAGVGKTKTATVAAIEFLKKYNKKTVLCALTYAASKSLANHMLQQLLQVASQFNKDKKDDRILLMEDLQNLLRLHKYKIEEDIPQQENYIIRGRIRQIQANPNKELSFLFYNGLVQQSVYFQQEKLLRYFTFNTQVLLSLIKLNEQWSILELFKNLDRVARKQSTTPQFHQMYKDAVRLTIKNTKILITDTAKAPYINDLQGEDERFTPQLGVLDEARQATLIDTYCLLSLDIKRLALLGDQHQLSLQITNHYNSLQISPLEILESNKNIPRITLTHNYRMSKEIQEFNQMLTYRNSLCSGNQRFTTGKHQNSFFKKPIFMVTHNVSEQFISQHQDHGHFNQGQIQKIKGIVQHFNNWKADFGKIAILTFYRGQVQKIKAQFERQIKLGLTVYTADAFQGGQKDYVIVSCVRSNKYHNLGHTNDKRRINVAFTRPRRGLIIVGDPNTLVQGNKHHSTWRKTWRYLLQRQAVEDSPKKFFIHPVKLFEQFENEFNDLSTEDHFDEEDRAEVDGMTPQQIHQYFEAQRQEALQGMGFDEVVFLPFIASNQR